MLTNRATWLKALQWNKRTEKYFIRVAQKKFESFFMRKSVYLIIFLLSFLAGIVLLRFFFLPFLFFLVLLILLAVIILFFPKFWVLPFLLILALFLAFLRLKAIEPEIDKGQISFYNGQKVEFTGLVCEEPDKKVAKQKIVLCADKIFLNKNWQIVSGRVLLNASLYPEFYYGDYLFVKGNLKAPKRFTYKNQYGQEIEFAYDSYLKRYKIYSLLYYPEEIKTLKKGQGNFVRQRLFDLKARLVNQINIFLPEPQAGFLGGLLWGAKNAIDPELLAYFNKTGTTHIIALSGFNITIIGVLLFLVSPWIFIKRQVAYWLVLAVIILFVLFTGAQASVVRAAIMGSLALTAYYLGRPKSIFILLLLAAVMMVFINPLIMFYDVGFQLSFLATVGLLYIAPKLEVYFLWLPKKFALRESAVATLSAIMATLPLIAYEFKRISLIAFLTNILILPAIPLAMALGFLLIVFSFINPFLGSFFSALVWFVLTYVILVVRVTAQIPGVQVLINMSLFSVWLWYLLLALFVGYLHRFELKRLKNRLKVIF